jgi:hypothetical protein
MGRIPNKQTPAMTERQATVELSKMEGRMFPTNAERTHKPSGELVWVATSPRGKKMLRDLDAFRKKRRRLEAEGLTNVEILERLAI